MAPTATNHINASFFRDPTTAWLGPDKRWRVIIGSQIKDKGLAFLYRSKDFVYWIKAKHPLHSENYSGMWECPDFFPVSTNSRKGVDTSIIGLKTKHVLKASVGKTPHDCYIIGTYNVTADKFIPEEGSMNGVSALRYDYGKFYASKTFFDSARTGGFCWDGLMNHRLKKMISRRAIPRGLWLDKSGKQLVQWPIPEVEKLRAKKVNLPSKLLRGKSLLPVSGITAAQADVEISFEITKFEKAEVLDPNWTNPQLLCSQKGASVKGALVLMCSDQNRSSLNNDNDKTTYGAFLDVDPVHEKLSLRSLIDHSIVESFGGGGKACITARVYPTLAIDDEAHFLCIQLWN
ncbi:hypothetical protein Patl1_33498 [Pistacia atlantica]|uniref:Uncharacterized protein n=1 Tax=Pistacia atlantica TaxID=434234 RepID=A0ACC0ZVH9_9ROSI|nr:hypothetical protein Patl1_33498 [Pistacia atlantica]